MRWLLLLAVLVGCDKRQQCVRGHDERVWYQPPPIYINAGSGVLVPITQPGYWVTAFACDEYAEPDAGAQRRPFPWH